MDTVLFLVKDRYSRLVYAGRDFGAVERDICDSTEKHGGSRIIYARTPHGEVAVARVTNGMSQRTVEGLPFTDGTR